jgi:hypothetical protein
MRRFNDPYLDTLGLMQNMSEVQLEILRQYTLRLKAAYAEKEREDNGTKTVSGKA